MYKLPLLILTGFAALAGLIVYASNSYWGSRNSFPLIRTEADLDPISRAAMYAAHGDCPKALEVLKGILAQEPNNKDALESLADCQVQSRDLKAALATTETLAKLDSSPRIQAKLKQMREAESKGLSLARNSQTPSPRPLPPGMVPPGMGLPMDPTHPPVGIPLPGMPPMPPHPARR